MENTDRNVVPGFGDTSPTTSAGDPGHASASGPPAKQSPSSPTSGDDSVTGYKRANVSVAPVGGSDQAVIQSLQAEFERFWSVHAVQILALKHPAESAVFLAPLFGVAIALALFGLGPVELIALAVFLVIPIVGTIRLLSSFGVDVTSFIPGVASAEADPAAAGAAGVAGSAQPPKLQEMLPADTLSWAADGLASFLSSGIKAVDKAASWQDPHRSLRAVCVCWLAYSYLWMVTGRLSLLVLLALAVGAATGYRMFRNDVDRVVSQFVAPWVPKAGSAAALCSKGVRVSVGKASALVRSFAAAAGSESEEEKEGDEQEEEGAKAWPAMLAVAAGLGLFVYLFWPLMSVTRVLNVVAGVVIGSEVLAPLAGDPLFAPSGASGGSAENKKNQ